MYELKTQFKKTSEGVKTLENNNIIKIKIFASWTNTTNIYNNIMHYYDWNYDDKYGVEYIFTLDNDFTHAILMNIITPKLSLKKTNIIGLAQEPGIFLKNEINPQITDFYKKSIKSYFIGTTEYIKSDKSFFKEANSYILPLISYKQVNFYINNYPEKTKLINYVYSYKNLSGPKLLYNYRHLLGNSILNNGLPIDIYGNCTDILRKKFKDNKNIHFKFLWEDIHKIYENYKFCIVIENTRENEYFSEKITIPLMCGCVPIYLGCKNIDSYFKEYVIHLNGDIKNDMILLRDIINKPDKYYKKIDIQEIKEKIHLKNIIHQEFLQ